MNQENLIPENNKIYSYLNQEDKHFFGGYFNLAYNNIENTLKECSKRLGLEVNFLEHLSKDQKSIVDWEREVKMLKEYFPLINFLDLDINNDKFKAKRDHLSSNLKICTNAIKSLRNYYTHYYHKELNFEVKFHELLDDLLLQTALNIKKKKVKNDKLGKINKTKEFISEKLNTEIDKLCTEKLEFLKNKKLEFLKNKKLELEKKSEKFNYDKDDINKIKAAIFNDAFKHILYQKINLHQKRTSKYDNSDNESLKPGISESGLIFLLSMFLSKKENVELKSSIKGYKGTINSNENTNSLKNMVTHWVYNDLSFKGLKQRVRNEFDKETLLMQIVDELSKVPNEVYNFLSEKDKETFLEDINEYNQENNKNPEESKIIHPVIRKRYDDKFTYFALRYLDEYVNFPHLKFQIHLGNYITNRTIKDLPSSQTERIIINKINVFGKLSEINKYKNDLNQILEVQEDNQNWQIFPNPSYNFIGNNIPVYIDFNHFIKKYPKEHKGTFMKILNAKNHDKKIEKLEVFSNLIKEKKIIISEPTFLLSVNELPSLLYEILINKKTHEQIEEILIDKLIEQYKNIHDFDTIENPSKKIIPKTLLNKQKEFNYSKLEKDISIELKITKDKENILEENNKEVKNNSNKRKYVFYSKEQGQEATWIMNDIKSFMPKDKKVTWKGFQHAESQKFISLYNSFKNDAKELIFNDWNDEISEKIKKCFTRIHFEYFYEEYLTFRTEFFQIILNQLIDSKDNTKTLKDAERFFKKKNYEVKKIDDTKIENILRKPLNLPRDLFDDKPKKEREIIKFCQEQKLQKNFQSFYNKDIFKREYTNFIKFETKPKFDKDVKRLTIKSEKAIYQVQKQDFILKLIADDLFLKVFNQKINFNLNEVYQTPKERLENQEEAYKQRDRNEGDKSENIYNTNFIWNKLVSLSLFNHKLKIEKIKIKDIGKFRKYEQNEKVTKIVEYLENKEFTEDFLIKELDSYEKIRREKLLNKIHELEKVILYKHNFDGENHPSQLEDSGNPNFRNYIQNGFLKNIQNNLIQQNDLTNQINFISNLEFSKIKLNDVKNKDEIIQKAIFLILIRNKFSHNELLNKDIFLLIEKTFRVINKNEKFSEYYYKFTEKTVNEFIEIMNDPNKWELKSNN